MIRLEEFLMRDTRNSITLCTTGIKRFCRLGCFGYWSITEKDFPIEFRGGRQVEHPFSAIGYGETFEQAITEAFARLPG